MTKAGARGGSLSTPHIAAPAAESDRYQGMPNDLTAAVMAMAGHDLRQPLQVIITAHDVLARRLSGGEERTLLTLIEGAAMRLASTLDGLVETLRLEGAPTHDQHGPVSLHPILAGLASELAAAAELKGIELRVIPASAVISSHPVLLSGILRNLIRNAIEYTPRGGRVLVGCRRRGGAYRGPRHRCRHCHPRAAEDFQRLSPRRQYPRRRPRTRTFYRETRGALPRTSCRGSFGRQPWLVFRRGGQGPPASRRDMTSAV
jgi:signal transduction histidine kinase